MFRWSGLTDHRAALTGSLVALLFQSTIAVFDGHSAGWGFSKGDMTANEAGVALFATQQVDFGEQKVSLRYSFSSSIHPEYRPELLGCSRLTQWLNLELGYSGSGITGGSANPPLNQVPE